MTGQMAISGHGHSWPMSQLGMIVVENTGEFLLRMSQIEV